MGLLVCPQHPCAHTGVFTCTQGANDAPTAVAHRAKRAGKRGGTWGPFILAVLICELKEERPWENASSELPVCFRSLVCR